MDHERDSEEQPPRKVVTLRPRASEGEGPDAKATTRAVEDPRSVWRRRQRLVRWAEGSWVLLAVALAVHRLWVAVARREVFDAEASMAFTLVVTIAILRGKALVGMGRGLASALSRRRSPQSAPEPPRLDDHLQSRRSSEKEMSPRRKS
jgi:hypothetical protein